MNPIDYRKLERVEKGFRRQRDPLAEDLRIKNLHERLEYHRKVRENIEALPPEVRKRAGEKAGQTRRLKNVPISLPAIPPRRTTT